MVLNDTKVFPARLFARKESGGKIEILAERIDSNQHVKAQIKSNRTPIIGVC
jgi:S-adenosylmethionine:tRNA ribosyltransferase-isomerase